MPGAAAFASLQPSRRARGSWKRELRIRRYRAAVRCRVLASGANASLVRGPRTRAAGVYVCPGCLSRSSSAELLRPAVAATRTPRHSNAIRRSDSSGRITSEAKALAFEVEALARDAEGACGGVDLAAVIAQRERDHIRLDSREG